MPPSKYAISSFPNDNTKQIELKITGVVKKEKSFTEILKIIEDSAVNSDNACYPLTVNNTYYI